MRPGVVGILLLLALGGSAVALTPTSSAPGPHSPNVADAGHSPNPVPRGESVQVFATLRAVENVTKVNLVHCRVQAYACAPAAQMTRGSGTEYAGRIPWNGDFFAGVTTVGYQFLIHYQNGSIEQSPLEHVPSRPPDLPPEGSVYYYYQLAAKSPAAGPLLVAAAVLAALAFQGRRR